MIHDQLLATLWSVQCSFFNHLFTMQLSGYGVAVIVSAIILYALYIRRIFTRDIPPPISTWGLWLLLDIVAMCADLARGIFNIQLVTYTIGTFIVCMILLKRRNITWDKRWDNITTAFVVLSIALWFFMDNATLGLLVSLMGMTVATFPLFRAIMNGGDEPGDAWAVAVIGSALSYLNGNILSGAWLGIVQAVILCLILTTSSRKNAQA